MSGYDPTFELDRPDGSHESIVFGTRSAVAAKLRTQSSPADLRPGDELKWTDGLWYTVMDSPLVLEVDARGNPVSYAVPVASVKGKAQDTFTVEAETWLMVRRDVLA